MIGLAIGRLRVKRHAPLQQVDAGCVLGTGKQQHLAFFQFVLAEIEHPQGTRHRVGIGDRETRDALREPQAPIELAGSVEVLSVNSEMKARPETDIGVRLKSDFRCLYGCLKLVVLTSGLKR